MRSASYTRGVPVATTQNFDPLFRNGPPNNNCPSPNPTPVVVHNSPVALQHQQSSSVGLNQYRRHCASMSAAIPARTQNYLNMNDPSKNEWSTDSSDNVKAYKPKRWNGFFSFIFRTSSKTCSKKFLKNNKNECLSWFTLFCLIMVGYKFFSDGSFSAILTLSSAFQCFSMVVLNLKVISQHSVAGISQRSVLLIVICLLFRLISTLFYNGYLPVDKSGDWLYQGADISSAILGIILLVYSKKYCTTSVQKTKDTCFIIVPMIVAGILAVLIHPTLNQNFVADTAWTFALYLETFAMVPQLFMMGKISGEVEALTSHYVASMAASKAFTFLFWYFSYAELAPRRGGPNIAGWAVIISYLAQTLLFADFFYYYIKSIRIGRKMIIEF